MTPLSSEEQAALVAVATEGPWVASDQNHGGNWRLETDAPGYPNDGWIIGTFEGPDAEANAKLVAALANDALRARLTDLKRRETSSDER